MIVAAGLFSTMTRFSGVIIRLEGATPKEHWHIAPITTICPIFIREIDNLNHIYALLIAVRLY